MNRFKGAFDWCKARCKHTTGLRHARGTNDEHDTTQPDFGKETQHTNTQTRHDPNHARKPRRRCRSQPNGKGDAVGQLGQTVTRGEVGARVYGRAQRSNFMPRSWWSAQPVYQRHRIPPADDDRRQARFGAVLHPRCGGHNVVVMRSSP